METVEWSSKASIQHRSSPGTCAAPALARLIAPPVAIDVPILKVWPRSLELAAVTSAKERLTKATFGIATPLYVFAGSGPFTAMSSSPPPGARPGLVALATLLTQPFVRIPQLSGWPSYLKGRVPLFAGPVFGPPSTMGPSAWSHRQRSEPPGTPRMEPT